MPQSCQKEQDAHDERELHQSCQETFRWTALCLTCQLRIGPLPFEVVVLSPFFNLHVHLHLKPIISGEFLYNYVCLFARIVFDIFTHVYRELHQQANLIEK